MCSSIEVAFLSFRAGAEWSLILMDLQDSVEALLGGLYILVEELAVHVVASSGSSVVSRC